jgi:hypothetical protein
VTNVGHEGRLTSDGEYICGEGVTGLQVLKSSAVTENQVPMVANVDEGGNVDGDGGVVDAEGVPEVAAKQVLLDAGIEQHTPQRVCQ